MQLWEEHFSSVYRLEWISETFWILIFHAFKLISSVDVKSLINWCSKTWDVMKYTKPDTSIISTNKLIHDNWVTLSGAVAMYFWEQGKKILLDEKWFSEKVWKDETNPFPLFFWRLFLIPVEERWPFSLTTFVYLILPRVALIHAVLLSKSSKPILLWLFVSINRKRYSSNSFAFYSWFHIHLISRVRFSISFRYNLYRKTFDINQGLWAQITRYKIWEHPLLCSSDVSVSVPGQSLCRSRHCLPDISKHSFPDLFFLRMRFTVENN